MPTPVAIIGPLNPAALGPWFSPADVRDKPLPYQQGGAFLTTLLAARLRRGMPTIAITSNAAATEPVMRWCGPLLRLWVVRRRIRGSLRDGYREEVRLLREALREAGAPVTHAHWTYEYSLAALTPGFPPAVVTVHDHAGNMLKHLGPLYLPLYLMSRWTFRHAVKLTAPSPYIAGYVREKTGRDVTVIPNLLEEDAPVVTANRIARTSHTPIVVVLANDAAFKNVRGALLAFARWRSRGVAAELRVIGPGLQPDSRIAAWARSRNLADGVRFEGPVAHDEALASIAQCDILLHPSLDESFGGPVMEAMEIGIPVIAAREAGGCRFLLDEGKCGLLSSGRSPVEMTGALDRTWTNKEETSARVEAAKKRVLVICDPDAALSAYETCYEEALKRA